LGLPSSSRTDQVGAPHARILHEATNSRFARISDESTRSSPKFTARLALVAGKGFDRLRLPNPVRPGAVLTGSLQVIELRMSSRKADVHCLYEMVNQDGDLVMTMVGIQVVRRRNPVAD
jgi:acyl dehydratase